MTVGHPSVILPAETINRIRNYAAEAEQNRELHKEQLRLIYQEKWFKMFVPKIYGGLAFPLPQVLRTEEALAWADGSTAWVVTLCSGAGWFVGFLDPKISKDIFDDEKVCLAGSGASSGTAELTKGGYIINGAWKYASGALLATMFTANCVITQKGVPVMNDGKPVVKAFIFKNNEVALQTSWNSMGMIATGSHGFSIKGLTVPENRAFVIEKQHASLAENIYQYPFLQLAETTLAVNIAGMAHQFLDLCEPLLAKRVNNEFSLQKELMGLLRIAKEKINKCRFEFYEAVERSWLICEKLEPIPETLLNQVSETSRQLYRISIEQVNFLYPYAGLAAADMSTEINRVWRNIHTASQHTLFTMR